MSGGQDWAAEQISTTGDDMIDKQSCHSRVSDNELILVRWQDEQDGGWREGVVCAVVDCDGQIYTDRHDIYVEATHGDFALECTAILYDRHRNERAIVPLSKVTLVEKRCAMCGGEGTIVPGYMQQPIPCTKCECY